MVQGFFTIFYVDDAYFASRDPVFLQTALDILVKLFERVGLETNRLKTLLAGSAPNFQPPPTTA